MGSLMGTPRQGDASFAKAESTVAELLDKHFPSTDETGDHVVLIILEPGARCWGHVLPLDRFEHPNLRAVGTERYAKACRDLAASIRPVLAPGKVPVVVVSEDRGTSCWRMYDIAQLRGPRVNDATLAEKIKRTIAVNERDTEAPNGPS